MTAATIDHPQRRPDLEFVEPSSPRGRWTVHNPATGRYFRLGSGATELLSSLDGTRSREQVTGDRRPTCDTIGSLLESFEAMDLLVSTDQAGPVRADSGRFRFRPPFVIQVTVAENPRWLGPGSVAARVAGASAVAASAVLVAVLGLIALALQSGDLASGLTDPVQPGWLLFIPVALVLLNMGHELAHGATLGAAGATPRRLGVMLFYFVPAMFCDVTDAWRVRDRAKRTGILLAGPLFHAFAGGVLAIAALVARGSSGSMLAFTAVASYGFAVGNLLPFIRLDGYLAVISWFDLPKQREKSLADLRLVAAWLVFGGVRPHLRLRPIWLVFAVAAFLFPAYLVVTALGYLRVVLLPFGITGAVVLLMVWAGVGYLMARGLIRLHRHAVRPSPGRAAGLIVAVLVGVMAIGTLVVHRPTVTGAVVTRPDGTVEVAFQDQAWLRLPAPGDQGTMYRAALGRGPELGVLTISSPSVTTEVSAGAFLPISGLDAAVPAVAFEADVLQRSPSSETASHVDVRLAEEPVVATIYDLLVGSAVRNLERCDLFDCVPAGS
ncbi:MAG: hypothetical protein ACK5PP_02815 [Acidimicrobiales bacterium]